MVLKRHGLSKHGIRIVHGHIALVNRQPCEIFRGRSVQGHMALRAQCVDGRGQDVAKRYGMGNAWGNAVGKQVGHGAAHAVIFLNDGAENGDAVCVAGRYSHRRIR